MDLRIVFLFLSITVSCLGNAQNRDTSFIKVYSGSGYDYSRDVIQTHDSTFVITGSSSSFPSSNADVLLMKVGHYGDLTWSSSYGGSGDDWGTKVTELADSSLIVSGYTNSFGQGGFDFYLLKTDSLGTLEWSRTFGGFNWDLSHSHVVAENDDILIVGETQSFGNGNRDIMLVRTDSLGNEKWRKYYGGSGDDVAYDIAHNPVDSTIFIAGYTTTQDSGKQAHIIKLDYDGDTLVTSKLGNGFDDGFRSVKINSSGNLVLCGYFGSSATDKDFWFYTADVSDLSEIYNQTDGGDNIEIAFDFDYDTFIDDIYYCGSTTSFGYATVDQQEDLWLGNRYPFGGWLDYYGNFGEQGKDELRSIEWLVQGGIVAVGNTQFYSDSENGIVIFRINLIKDDPQLNGPNQDINSSTDEYAVPDNFSIYPNPFDEKIIIELKEVQSNTKASIFSLEGKLIDEYELSNYQNTISTRNWKKGFYLVRFTTNGQYSGTYKLMK